MDQEKPHKRRARYKGTHPRHFSEKYKEHQPEKYGETADKIRQKGNTPAGTHVPICVQEILDFLEIQPGQIGLDATLGYGGHSQAMLQQLGGSGHLYGIDADPIELVKTKARLEKAGYGPDLITVQQMNFAAIDQFAHQGLRFNFVLADLGVSSMQIDNPERGFSFKKDGPLDLRLNPQKGVPAWEMLKTLHREEIRTMLTEYADEPYAGQIAKAITARRSQGVVIDTTGTLRQIIEEALSFLPPAGRREAIKKSCQRSFQALRIAVNQEFAVLQQFLDKLPALLAPGGRVAILTFHSGEDRLVKQAFKEGQYQGLYADIARRVVRPSPEECRSNVRASSTKMRWAIKSENER